MIRMNVTVKSNVVPQLKSIQKKVANLPKEAYQEFKKNTPIRSGNARRKTKLRKNAIVADYPYAQRLDEGYSKQSPEGMIKPTEEFINQRFIDIITGKK